MAIFQDQPINLEAIRGVSPERFVQRAERQQQAIVGDFLRMQQGIQAGIQEFEQKREEKQNMQASLKLLKELGAVEGLSDESVKAGIKNAGGATNFLKTITDMETVAQQSRLREAQIAEAVAQSEAVTSGKPAVGKRVTMDELNQLRDQGYKPTVTFGTEGEMFMTGLGTFAPQAGGPTEADIAQSQAELAKTQAEVEKLKAQAKEIGKPKPLTASERMRLIETKVGDVTFGQYLQELKQTKKIKGGELHQRGLLNFDEDQIAAFDYIIREQPEFLKDMPQAVKDYYASTGGKPMVMTLGDGTIAEVNPQ